MSPATRRPHEATKFERFDRHADLVIIAGSGRPIDKACFYVSSAKLCRASSILRGIIHHSWRNHRRGEKPTIRLPRDEPRSMRILMSILHHRPLVVPVEPSILEMYYILLGVAKYNLGSQIRPWAPHWLTCARNADPADNPVLLFIAWQLGDADLVASLVKHWVTNAIYTEDGLATPSGQHFSRRPVLADMDVCRHISRTRRNLVERALNLWHTTLNGLKQEEDMEAKDYPQLKTTDPNADHACTAYVLGRLLQHEWKIIGETLPRDYRDYEGRLYLLSKLITNAQEGGQQFCTRPSEAWQDCRCSRLVSRMKRRYAELLAEDPDVLLPEWEFGLAQKAKWTGSIGY